MSWPIPVIGATCLPTVQQTPAAIASASFRYVDIASIDREQKTIVRADRVLVADAPSRARKQIKKGDVLVSTVRPNLNAVAQVPEELDGEIASTGLTVLRANPEILNSRYLFYRTQHAEFIAYLVANATGASYPAVSDAIVRRAPLPLPILKEQHRIAEILDEADLLRKQCSNADEKMAGLLPALFIKRFGNPESNPRGLRKESLGNLIKVKSGNFLPAKSMIATGGFPVYGGNGVNGFHDHYMFQDRKIVIGRVGAYCGAVHYSEPNAWITDNALYVSEMLEPLNDLYLVTALELANLNQYAGRAGQPLVSGSRIYPVDILVPQESDQDDFARFASSILKTKHTCDAARVRVNQLWELLLQHAFSGQLTDKWRQENIEHLQVDMAEQARLLSRSAPQELAS